MAKRVRVSDDGGTTYYTLPGNTAEFSNEAGEIDDTIFGQDFQSSQTGLIGGTISANALMKGFAGYVATIKKSGAATTLTDEPMSLVSGKTYVVTNTAKRLFNRDEPLVFEDGGTPIVDANIESIDHLFGRVTLDAGYTPSGAITVASGEYLPLTTVGCINEYTLTQTANSVDNTCMDTAQGNEGHRTFEYGLKTVSLEASGIYKVANGFLALLNSRAELIIEVNPDGNGKTVARGFFKPITTSQSGDVGDLEEENITFNLSVPDQENVVLPFGWLIANDSTLNTAIRKVLEAWEDAEEITVAYLPDGTNGWEGDAIVTDVTLTGGLEVMNEFAANFQITGNVAEYP